MHSSRTHSETRCNLSHGRSRPIHLRGLVAIKDDAFPSKHFALTFWHPEAQKPAKGTG
jgi:hypothetical protein